MSDALVTTSWVAERLGAPGVRVIDVPSSGDGYAGGHLPGAVEVAWKRDLVPVEDESSGHVIDAERFASLASRLGVAPEDTLVFYGDEGGRHACRAFWTFAYYRHRGAMHLMDGGRERWRSEGRELSTEPPAIDATTYPLPASTDDSLRATRAEIEAHLGDESYAVVDARTPGERAGEDVRAARGGRIPGSIGLFWKECVADDGASFRSREELAELCASIPREATVAAHCQLGMRSAHMWFVLRHVLGYERVKNYDGSWQEWGNAPDTPIEG